MFKISHQRFIASSPSCATFTLKGPVVPLCFGATLSNNCVGHTDIVIRLHLPCRPSLRLILRRPAIRSLKPCAQYSKSTDYRHVTR